MFELLGKHDTEGIFAYASERTCLLLTMRRADFQPSIQNMFIQDRGYRNELLVMALTQSLDDLRDHVMLFG